MGGPAPNAWVALLPTLVFPCATACRRLLGKLRVYDGAAQPLRFLAAIWPLLGAVWIGLSRWVRVGQPSGRTTQQWVCADGYQGQVERGHAAAPNADSGAAPQEHMLPIRCDAHCRIQDNWHHETDVMAGFALGLLMGAVNWAQAVQKSRKAA